MSSAECLFYKVDEPKNKLNKNLGTPIYNYEFLRKEFDVNNPILKVRSSTRPTWNYIHIPVLNKYYFVEQKTFIAQNLWNIVLELDVLMSYKVKILSSIATLTKNANYGKYFEGANFDIDVRKNEEYIYFNNPFNENLQNVLLTVASRGSY